MSLAAFVAAIVAGLLAALSVEVGRFGPVELVGLAVAFVAFGLAFPAAAARARP